MSILELHAVGKSYGSVVAMHEVSLCVEAGSRAAIVGPSGSGKTTLLRVVAGFETPDAGRVMLNGEVLADGGRIVPAHLRGIGYVPQEGALFPHLDVAANIAFGLREDPSRRHAQVGALMDMVALDRKLSTRWPHELSGGQQQRVALARALARRPQLMLLDEPFSALDTGLRAATRKAVAQVLADAGVTTVLVTHDQAEALSFADRLAVMRDGRLVQAGRPLDVYRRPVDEATALFLGDAVIVPARLSGGWADCALGRIEVDDPRSGTARIMVRPEQIEVSAASRGTVPQCHGTIVDIDFSGQLCELSIRLASTLQSSGDDDPLLTVRVPSAELPVAGNQVCLKVTGRAHVLAARAGEV